MGGGNPDQLSSLHAMWGEPDLRARRLPSAGALVLKPRPRGATLTEPDVAIVGGGIVGLATSLALLESHRLSVLVLEAEGGVGEHQTGHNSGVIHAGVYYQPGTLKAELCRSGLELMYRFCEDEGIPHRRCGKLVVAVDPRELAALDAIADRGLRNGVRLRRIPGGQIAEFEPNAVGMAGLWVEETGVVDYRIVAQAIRKRIERLGGLVRTGSEVVAINRRGGRYRLETTSGAVSSRLLVNCAGLQSDRVARLAGADPEVRIVPFRGEYYRLRPSSDHLVRGLIYPVPDPGMPFLGVHFTRGITNRVEAGPNAVLATKREGYRRGDFSLRDLADWATFPGFWRMGLKHWRSGIDEVRRSLSRPRFVESLRRLVPAIAESDLEVGGTGVRAQAVDRNGGLLSDFRFLEQEGALHVLNAPSPAATASLAIGRFIAARLARAVEGP